MPQTEKARILMLWVLLFLTGVFAGAQNALAGGGSFVTLGMLVLAGLDPRAANITSTIALFPGQVATGYAGRRMVSGAQELSFKALFLISFGGALVGALLLVATPPAFFARLVPWLVLLATAVFFWGSFIRQTSEGAPLLGPRAAAAAQLAIAIYGGYFGGGIGFLMLAVLTIAGLRMRSAGAMKNVLVATINASAAVIFVFSRDVHWLHSAVLGVGNIVGGLVGVRLLPRMNEQRLKIGVVALGVALTIGLFLRGS